MKLVSIILLNWNGREYLLNCLNSIREHTQYRPYEIIVVDNGSKDGSVGMIWNKFPEVNLICNTENKGIPKASNQGKRAAKGDYFIFMNNDTLVTDGWMKDLVGVAETDDNIASVGATLIEKGDMEKIKPRKEVKRRTSVCSACMLMTRTASVKVGDYDERNFAPYGGDETDWNLRAWNLGYEIIETKGSVVVHIGSVDTTRQNPNQYLHLNTHRLRAILYNVSPWKFIKMLPGLGLIFLQSISEGKARLLLESYWVNIKERKNILRERKRRKKGTIKYE